MKGTGSIYEAIALQMRHHCSFVRSFGSFVWFVCLVKTLQSENIYPLNKMKWNRTEGYQKDSLLSQFEQITDINNASSLIKFKIVSKDVRSKWPAFRQNLIQRINGRSRHNGTWFNIHNFIGMAIFWFRFSYLLNTKLEEGKKKTINQKCYWIDTIGCEMHKSDFE